MNAVLKLLQQWKSVFLNLSTPQKILSVGSVLILLGSLAYLLYSANQTDYGTLYSGLNQEDAGAVVEALKAKKTPFRLSDNGVISVPKDKLYETRLAMATQGLPKGSGVGFEIFDQQKLGSSDFVQKINYQRALQGELARSINEMDEVMESRVHLVLPQDSLFVEDQKPPSAAVVLKLRPGAKLQSSQVQGIVNLVSSAVQGLKEDNVTIVSTDGQVIFKKNGQDSPLQVSGLQLEHKNRLEEDLHNKVQSMLDQVLGRNKAITRVTLDLDFNQTQVAEDTYEPDSAIIRSQQRSIESSDGKDGGSARGNPDAPINLDSKLLQSSPQDPSKDQQQQQKNTFNRQRETVNYEINHINRQIYQAPGKIKKLSVAVIVDGTYQMKPDKDGKNQPVFAPRSAEELKSVEDIVKRAVGYDEARGDQITVSNIAFAGEASEMDMVKAESTWLKLLKNNQKLLFNLLLTALVFFFIIKPFMKKFQELRVESEETVQPNALPEIDAPPQAELLPQPEERPSLRRDVVQLIQKHPDKATEVIRAWLHEQG